MEFMVGSFRWNSWLEPFRVNFTPFRATVFVHMEPAQLCAGNGVSFCMCSAVNVACFLQNIRHVSASVRLRLVAFKCL